MSSILTNNSAMVALQTLKSINSNLSMTQNEISTGKSVASAKDNSAVWAISKVMESDVNGFQAISESLSLGESTVAVARQAAETVSDLLTEIKGKVVASQEENVDREKIQTDINALRDQITSVVGAAQFNGLNLVEGTDAVEVLSSLDRS
ncbi:MAG: flagellin, partial [Pseudomonadota bacterium]|nr:flagellin [Pseudomonadota bacterium]